MTLPRSSLLRSLAVGLVMLCASAPSSVAQTRPGAPGQLEALVFLNQVRLTWDAASGEPTTYRIEAGSSPAASNLAVLTVSGTQVSFNTAAPSGVYFVRVRAVNAAGAGDASNEVMVVVGACPSPPRAPSGITATATGAQVTLAWLPSTFATSFVLEAGSAPLLSDVFVGDVGSTLGITAGVAPGTYFLRVRARNACGTSPPSPEALLVVPGGTRPADLTAAVVGASATLAWAPPDGSVPDSYLVDVGTSPGASNLGTISASGAVTSLTASGVAPGTYYVRVRALTGGTSSGPSNEAVVVVSSDSAAPTTIAFSGIAATAPLVRYEEAGVTIVPAAGTWEARTIYGAPAPYVGFSRVGSSNTSASLMVSAGGSPFRASSLDVYSSVTTIPVVLTGMLGPHIVFSVNTTVPNTFGTFARLANPFASAAIDRLLITMSDDWSGNPMGIDNLVVVR